MFYLKENENFAKQINGGGRKEREQKLCSITNKKRETTRTSKSSIAMAHKYRANNDGGRRRFRIMTKERERDPSLNKSKSSKFELIQVRYKLIIIGKQNRKSTTTLASDKNTHTQRE